MGTRDKGVNNSQLPTGYGTFTRTSVSKIGLNLFMRPQTLADYLGFDEKNKIISNITIVCDREV